MCENELFICPECNTTRASPIDRSKENPSLCRWCTVFEDSYNLPENYEDMKKGIDIVDELIAEETLEAGYR